MVNIFLFYMLDLIFIVVYIRNKLFVIIVVSLVLYSDVYEDWDCIGVRF